MHEFVFYLYFILLQQMKHFDKNVPRVHRCISLVYNEIGEERARKILDARAQQQAAETSSALGKAPKTANLSSMASTSTPKSAAKSPKEKKHILVTPQVIRTKKGKEKTILKKVFLLPYQFCANGNFNYHYFRPWCMRKRISVMMNLNLQGNWCLGMFWRSCSVSSLWLMQGIWSECSLCKWPLTMGGRWPKRSRCTNQVHSKFYFL